MKNGGGSSAPEAVEVVAQAGVRGVEDSCALGADELGGHIVGCLPHTHALGADKLSCWRRRLQRWPELSFHGIRRSDRSVI
jgi:hypothetical protein